MFEIAASDAPKWVAAVKEMTGRILDLGPNPLKKGHSPEADFPELTEILVET